MFLFASTANVGGACHAREPGCPVVNGGMKVYRKSGKSFPCVREKSIKYFWEIFLYALPSNQNDSQPLKNRTNPQKTPNSPT